MISYKSRPNLSWLRLRIRVRFCRERIVDSYIRSRFAHCISYLVPKSPFRLLSTLWAASCLKIPFRSLLSYVCVVTSRLSVEDQCFSKEESGARVR
jgi:hypothetical protein